MEERTLLDWVLVRFPSTPKKRARGWILGGRVHVGGSPCRDPRRMLADPGPTLRLARRDEHAFVCEPPWQAHPRLALLYLDAHVAAVDKGAGLLAVPVPGERETSALAILERLLEGSVAARGMPRSGPRIPAALRHATPLTVHRIDKFTTGVMCLALTPLARERLVPQFREHSAVREYIAFVHGRAPRPTGTWRHWLVWHERTRRQQPFDTRALAEATPAGRTGELAEAVTHFEVLGELTLSAAGGAEAITKLRLRLETGLTHQIRAQAAHAGLPLIGDRAYHPRYAPGGASPPIAFSRQALHAEMLEIEHPARPGSRIHWRAPLPSDLSELEAALRGRTRRDRGV